MNWQNLLIKTLGLANPVARYRLHVFDMGLGVIDLYSQKK